MSKRSQHIEALFQQGQRCHLAGRFAEAEALYRQVLAAAPRHPEALHALGALALQAGHAAASEALVGQAIALKPAASFQVTRAHALLALHRPQEAEQAARIALRGRPNSAEAHQVLGHALNDRGEAEAAVEAYEAALRLDPGLPDIRNNLGAALRQAGQLEHAEAMLLSAPVDAGTLMNLSSVQKELGAFDRAAATLQRALEMAPDDPVLRYNWSLLLLLLNRPEEAWPGWEQRFRSGAVRQPRLTEPQWDGGDLGGRTLLVLAEQGLGDTIQFCRYLPAIQGNVVFEPPPRLHRLLATNPAMPPMAVAGEARFDVVVPLLSLPARLRAKPVDPPYLFPEPDRIAAWQARIGGDGFRVGIAWQGFSGRHEDKGRSIPLKDFAPLAQVPGIRLISLQKGEGEDQIAGAGFPVETLADLDAGPDAFVDTAAVMKTLDLIITSDTSIPHLAGALACPVWVALRRVPDWRWLLERTDSPWYPSMRLFRQVRDGEWGTVFAAMAEALVR